MGTVYLSSAFVQRNTTVLFAAAGVALALAVWEWRRVTRKPKPTPA